MSVSGRQVSSGVLIGTPQVPFRELRALSVENADSALDLTSTNEYSLSDVSGLSGFVDLWSIFGNSFMSLYVGFYGGTIGAYTVADGDTFGITIAGYRSDDGLINPPMLLAQTADAGCIIGTKVVTGVTDALWADTITLSVDDTPGQPVIYDSGHDRIAWLCVDPCGCRYLLLYTNKSNGATAGECPGVAARGFVI